MKNIYVIRQVSQNIQYMKINDVTWNGEDRLENYFKPQRYISRLMLKHIQIRGQFERLTSFLSYNKQIKSYTNGRISRNII